MTLDVGPVAPLKLSPKLLEILTLMAEGKTTPEMSIILHKSRKTIDAQKSRIFNDLGASTATHAVAIALRRGLIP